MFHGIPSIFHKCVCKLSEGLGKIPMPYIADGVHVYIGHSYLLSALLSIDVKY